LYTVPRLFVTHQSLLPFSLSFLILPDNMPNHDKVPKLLSYFEHMLQADDEGGLKMREWKMRE